MIRPPTVPFRSILLVAFLWFLSIGIIFAQSPNRFQFQTTCSGPANGSWNYTAKEHGSCTCPSSIPLPSFDPAYHVNVCQNGGNLSGAIPGLGQLRGSISGQQVNFTTNTKFSINQSGIKINDTLTDTNHGTLQGNTISGSVSSNWRVNVTGPGLNVSCGCNLNGTFKVNLSGGGGGDDDDDDDGRRRT